MLKRFASVVIKPITFHCRPHSLLLVGERSLCLSIFYEFSTVPSTPDMAGLVKAKKYDWKDSNLALFGSDTERNVSLQFVTVRSAFTRYSLVAAGKESLCGDGAGLEGCWVQTWHPDLAYRQIQGIPSSSASRWSVHETIKPIAKHCAAAVVVRTHLLRIPSVSISFQHSCAFKQSLVFPCGIVFER